MNKTAAVLENIYAIFEDWTSGEPWACRKGCSSCCTQNVTISAPEGAGILAFVQENQLESWLADRLQSDIVPHRPRYTINSLARACIEGREIQEKAPPPSRPCPFLANGSCHIYPARPFSCRCFLSLSPCSPGKAALTSPGHLAAATVINQLIEHLGQRGYWGNMLDVLPALFNSSGPLAGRLRDGPGFIAAARSHTLKAQPLPGFMLDAADHSRVAPLVERILSASVDGKSVEDILNGG